MSMSADLPPVPAIPPGVSLAQVMAVVIQRLDALLDTRPLCVPCLIRHEQTVAAGANPQDLPPVNIAAVVVDGTSQCLSCARTPVALPGQTPAGLILP